jgi:hypothetical protein
MLRANSKRIGANGVPARSRFVCEPRAAFCEFETVFYEFKTVCYEFKTVFHEFKTVRALMIRLDTGNIDSFEAKMDNAISLQGLASSSPR